MVQLQYVQGNEYDLNPTRSNSILANRSRGRYHFKMRVSADSADTLYPHAFYLECSGTCTYHTYWYIYTVPSYLRCGTSRYQLVIPVMPVVITSHTTTDLHELKPVLDAGRGGWTCKKRAAPDAVGVEISGALEAFMVQGSLHKLWANVIGPLTQAPARRQPEDNRASTAPTSGS